MHTDYVKYLRAAQADAADESCRRPPGEPCCCRSIALIADKQFELALQHLDEVLTRRRDCASAHSQRAFVLTQLGKPDDAIVSCDRAIALSPLCATAHTHRGLALAALKQYKEAMASYSHALSLDRRYAPAYINLGDAFNAQNQSIFALLNFEAAILIEPDWAIVHARRAYTLELLGKADEALQSYETAFRIAPDHPYLLGDLINTQLATCSWGGLESRICSAAAAIENRQAATSPWVALTLFDSPRLQRIAAERWDADIPNSPMWSVPPSSGPKRRPQSRIRLAYFSPDFRDHVVARFTEGLFERHDRARFELFAFSFGPGKDDPVRKRMESLFDHFIDVSDKSDGETVRLARALDIDIAVDLCGYTHQSRSAIFRARVAPVQVSYLGYAGTSGSPSIDYLLGDPTIVPESQQPHYSEKIIYLPIYLAADSRRRSLSFTAENRQCTDRRTQFVFCCMSACEKILPNVFDVWMRILGTVPDSVLLLRGAPPTAQTNLRLEATKRGIESSRLTFAQNVSLPEYMARLQSADLFLDTFPYNAHSTASDALWAGLPVLTCAGESYASRVAASLLKALNLPELITSSLEEYESLAVQLASDRRCLADIRRRLTSARLTAPLFDIDQITANIEAGLAAAHRRYGDGLPVDHIYLQNKDMPHAIPMSPMN